MELSVRCALSLASSPGLFATHPVVTTHQLDLIIKHVWNDKLFMEFRDEFLLYP